MISIVVYLKAQRVFGLKPKMPMRKLCLEMKMKCTK